MPLEVAELGSEFLEFALDFGSPLDEAASLLLGVVDLLELFLECALPPEEEGELVILLDSLGVG